MPRRPHRKSRNGCIECKRRHVKCDEKRPTCSNCITSERHCEYAGLSVISSGYSRSSRSRSRASASPSTVPIPLQVSNEISIDSPPVNMLHAELLHQFTTNTSKAIGAGDGQLTPAHIVNHALSAPYLMNQILAMAALHLSLLRPAQQKYYRHSASQLQTHALSLYNTNRPVINQETCVAMLLFSSFLGMHMLCDSINYRESSFTSFLDRFVDCLRLHQGVRIVAKSAWTALRGSDLESLLSAGEALPKLGAALTPEFKSLLELIRAAKVGDILTKTYQQAIEALQSVSSAIASGASEYYTRNYLISWPTLISPEYVDALALRRPEAVVILAHYAALLHQQRSSWMFGDSGRFIIQTIDAYLGPPWAEWLVWPYRVLDETLPTPESTSIEY